MTDEKTSADINDKHLTPIQAAINRLVGNAFLAVLHYLGALAPIAAH